MVVNKRRQWVIHCLSHLLKSTQNHFTKNKSRCKVIRQKGHLSITQKEDSLDVRSYNSILALGDGNCLSRKMSGKEAGTHPYL